jgi:hypothetical protein
MGTLRMHPTKLTEVMGNPHVELRVDQTTDEVKAPSSVIVFTGAELASIEDYDLFANRLLLMAQRLGWRQRARGFPAPGVERAPWWIRLLSGQKIKLISSLQVDIPGLR